MLTRIKIERCNLGIDPFDKDNVFFSMNVSSEKRDKNDVIDIVKKALDQKIKEYNQFFSEEFTEKLMKNNQMTLVNGFSLDINSSDDNDDLLEISASTLDNKQIPTIEALNLIYTAMTKENS